MDLIAYLVYVGAGSLAAAILAWKQVDFRIRRKKRVTIASLTEDRPGRISGTVKAFGDLIAAGATGRACVLYRVEVRNADKVVGEEVRGTPFVVDDGTGTAVVDPNGARIGTLRFDSWSDQSTFNRPTPHTDALLERLGYTNPDTIKLHLFITEAIVVPGDRLDVHGAGMREADPDTGGDGYRATAMRVRMVGSAESELWIVQPQSRSRG